MTIKRANAIEAFFALRRRLLFENFVSHEPGNQPYLPEKSTYLWANGGYCFAVNEQNFLQRFLLAKRALLFYISLK